MDSELVFASANPSKVAEISAKLDRPIRGLSAIGFQGELPETTNTLEGNAEQKARFIFDFCGKACFADDTGLEVEILNGAPGVHSAYYGGIQRMAVDNMDKLLAEMASAVNRRAQFRTVIHLILDGTHFSFEGVVHGSISREKRGNAGFGYDPLFIPDGCSRSFAEMSLTEKNYLSHRARAVEKLDSFLRSRSI